MDQTISIDVVTPVEFRGQVLLALQPAAELHSLTAPGKEIGDIRLMDAGGDDRPARAAVSLGPREKIDGEAVRRAGAAIAHWLAKNRVTQAGLDLSSMAGLDLLTGTNALCEGLLLGNFRFDRYKTPTDELVELHLSLVSADTSEAVKQALEHASIVASAVNLAREWAHEPPNVVNPLTLAERVQALAAEFGLKCSILDDEQLKKMGAGAILAVGKGSHTPSRLILVEYPGAGDGGQAPVVLVGKSITFDTGGYSLKDREGMVGMKYDKCGGMDVIAVLLAAAQLGLKTPLVGNHCGC